MKLPRPGHETRLRELLRDLPVVAILGARQVGKSTLARRMASTWPGGALFDLEDPADLARLDDPRLALSAFRGLVVIDEVQRRPDLFPVLRVLADRRPRPARFLVLGSASPELLRQSSESLAGRIAFHDLDGFSLEKSGAARGTAVAAGRLSGVLPGALRVGPASRGGASFVRTFLERDLAQLGVRCRRRP